VSFSSAGAVRRAQPGNRALPTGIQLNYANLLDNLAEVGAPHLIGLAATFSDIDERAHHLKKVLDAVTSYVKAVVGDTCYRATTKIHDETGLLADAASDIVAALKNAVDKMIDDAEQAA
jgi:hypothetical protein